MARVRARRTPPSLLRRALYILPLGRPRTVDGSSIDGPHPGLMIGRGEWHAGRRSHDIFQNGQGLGLARASPNQQSWCAIGRDGSSLCTIRSQVGDDRSARTPYQAGARNHMVQHFDVVAEAARLAATDQVVAGALAVFNCAAGDPKATIFEDPRIIVPAERPLARSSPDERPNCRAPQPGQLHRRPKEFLRCRVLEHQRTQQPWGVFANSDTPITGT
jgi:hypothetical protein